MIKSACLAESEIITMFNILHARSMEFRARWDRLQSFMLCVKVERDVQMKVFKYITYCWKMEHEANMQSTDALDFLTPYLRKHLLVRTFEKTLTRHPFFAQLPTSALHHLCIQ